ncbi:OmpA family protein [Sinisalibacter aestuarii]|uniref:OmpA-like domain-containing protein n=1 Tax=Sinisalibacter aestuarii TaxID=2949426 RepID=A0ABQ5LR32_9RHOB|nr:OmpA family protein [Sinisalibacter aestuarii]GKY87465.1 hypothetical protein STA1M1_13340 [Sinisalibacter aestuarii]
MRKNLKSSVAIPLIIALATPGAAFSQDIVVDCDPATDPECIVPETGAEPTAETSDEEAPPETQSAEEATSESAEEVPDPVEPEVSEPATEDDTSGIPEAETSETEAEAANEAEPQTPEPDATSTELETVDTPEVSEPTEPAEDTLPIEEPETVLSEDTGLTEEAAAAEAAAAEELTGTAPVAAAAGGQEASQAGAEPEVDVTTVTEESTRTSEQEFSAKSEEADGLSTLEKLLIVGVGAAVVGGLIENNRIVQNTGDRVVLQRDDGSLYVLRDDDVLLRRPGYEVATRTYSDGSTLSEITKSDGSIVRTMRDPRGRVLQRTRVLPSGLEIMLFDDTAAFDPVVVEELPLRRSSSLDYAEADATLTDALSADLMADVGRRFSLSQIRNIRAVRELVSVIDLEAITFDTNSAAIRASEARKLDRLGSAMNSVIDERPWEVFLIEGHTDAVGSAVANLTLSDRRAESLALALTEYYGIPSENLVVQGYGERYLKVPVETDERANRRVTVRRITQLLGMGPAN